MPDARSKLEGHSVCSQGAQLYCEKNGFTIHKHVSRPKYRKTHYRDSSGGGVGGQRQDKVNLENDVFLGFG